MKLSSIFVLFIAILTSVTVVRGSVPIIVNTPARLRAAMKLVTDAQDQLKNGDVAGAKRNVDAALQVDPTMWPALYVRAQIFASQGKYELAIQDCNEALRQYRGCVEAALLRAKINSYLRKYAEASKEFNYLVSLHPRGVTLARALSDRAWFLATCSDPSFRNGQQAVKDAKAACSIMVWKDEHMIDIPPTTPETMAIRHEPRRKVRASNANTRAIPNSPRMMYHSVNEIIRQLPYCHQ